MHQARVAIREFLADLQALGESAGVAAESAAKTAIALYLGVAAGCVVVECESASESERVQSSQGVLVVPGPE
jgi:hypothetical protein